MICIARTFGAPETVPAGKHARSRSNGVTPSAQLADDLRDEVRHVREALGLEEALDAHRARPADAREVVAAEVDEHHVLGAVLLGGEQALGVAVAGLRSCRRSGSGSRGRPRSLTSVSGEEPIERDAVELEQEEVRRRVDAPERAVELERRGGRRPLGALREHDLERVAGHGCAPCTARTPRSYAAWSGERRSAAPARRRGLCLQHELALEPARRRRRGRRRAPRRRRCRGRSGRASSATTKRLSGRPGPSAGQRHGRLELRDVVVGEVADDRHVRAPPPPRTRRAASRSRRTSAGRAARARPTRAGSSPPPGFAQAQVRPERGEQVGGDVSVGWHRTKNDPSGSLSAKRAVASGQTERMLPVARSARPSRCGRSRASGREAKRSAAERQGGAARLSSLLPDGDLEHADRPADLVRHHEQRRPVGLSSAG